ncbi:hypothetical protein IPA_09590 [Ignicoccus pacificus DSM 13166]|uniref:RNA methyltransferase n=1 Tax=Ignicoccus pacificus DSM 13166 TaxID=940294 RepID=A0A977KD58_9CREN|nr:hypothetical protein IPA_09590 [Ignicoccus pacificus DSM 13166]
MRCKHRRLRIAIPSDALSANPSLREKTLVAGYIARAAAALRSEAIDIYMTESDEGLDVLLEVLRYLSEPAYLRKVLIPLKPQLKFAGILPPVTIKPLNEGFKDQEDKLFFKVGVILSCLKNNYAKVLIDKDDEVTIKVEKCRRYKEILVGIDEKGKPRKVYPRRYGIWRGHYLGFQVRTFENIYDLLRFYDNNNYKKVGTSRYGEWPGKLREFVGNDVALIYGSPSAGLLERYGELNLDALINIIPCQGVKTVRLEEALWATVGLYSSLEFGL